MSLEKIKSDKWYNGVSGQRLVSELSGIENVTLEHNELLKISDKNELVYIKPFAVMHVNDEHLEVTIMITNREVYKSAMIYLYSLLGFDDEKKFFRLGSSYDDLL